MGKKLLLIAMLLLVACGNSELKPKVTPDPRLLKGESEGATSGQEIQGEIRVLAAESLRAPLDEITSAFEKIHPGATMKLGYGAAVDLATRISKGEQVEVFLSDDPKAMESVPADRVSDRARIFARTKAGIAYPVATLKPSNLTGGQGFVGYLLAKEGQDILKRHGYVV